ncbi:DUF5995 family protein [Gordonia sp. (in: high G+C Gram-positive bacteria)]|uniref:SRPBCC family protein n=1 Tax=Gordonia sp. (in: high G+C Gram-positive bacteria) TaxID=84139 RepID=UPI003F9AC0A6
MREFRLRRDLDCSPEQAWTMLTEPDQMNRWSTARIELRDPGVGDRADGVGALRTVTLPGGRAKLREVVERSDFARSFDYRVYDGGPALLDHSGRQEITPTPTGCTLTWTARMQLVSQTATTLLANRVRGQVAESLDLLAGLKPPAPVAPPTVMPRSDVDLTTSRCAATQVLTQQRETADRLAADDDPKQWFARVYSYVTDEMLGICDRGGVDNPDWVLSLIPVFDEYYTRSLVAFESGAPCEPMWQRAWSACERRDDRKPHVPVMKGLMSGVAAHIDADLPRAISQLHRAEYADRDLREFRPDYLRLSPVFSAASDRLLDDLPRSHKPWWTGIAARIHPQIRDALIARQGYDVGRHRFAAFAAAVDLAS